MRFIPLIFTAFIVLQACNSAQTEKQSAPANTSITLTEQTMLDKQSVLAFAAGGLNKNKQADKPSCLLFYHVDQ